MLLEFILALFIGTFAGIFTGLVPGIHINLVGAIIVSLSLSILSGIPAIYLVVFIVSMSITHVFIDFIPSIFLGAPEDGTELSVLPGHEMLKQGLGSEAVALTSQGCLYGLFIFLISILPLYLIAKQVNTFLSVSKLIPFLLILISLNLILIQKNKLASLFVFVFSGILGLIVLNLEMKDPLLPLLTGLFGTASILLSLDSKIDLKNQKINFKTDIGKTKPLLTASLFSPLSIFLPPLSPGQMATIGNQFSKLDRRGFLFLLGAINSLGMAFSFLAFFLLSKTRTGSAVAIKSLLFSLNWNLFLIIAFFIMLSGLISFYLVRVLSKKFILILQKFEYRKVSISVLVFISIITKTEKIGRAHV